MDRIVPTVSECRDPRKTRSIPLREGLDAIVRLVNYATARWIEEGLGREPTDEERRKFGFEFVINGKSVSWVGDCNVFAWHRQLPMEATRLRPL